MPTRMKPILPSGSILFPIYMCVCIHIYIYIFLMIRTLPSNPTVRRKDYTIIANFLIVMRLFWFFFLPSSIEKSNKRSLMDWRKRRARALRQTKTHLSKKYVSLQVGFHMSAGLVHAITIIISVHIFQTVTNMHQLRHQAFPSSNIGPKWWCPVTLEEIELKIIMWSHLTRTGSRRDRGSNGSSGLFTRRWADLNGPWNLRRRRTPDQSPIHTIKERMLLYLSGPSLIGQPVLRLLH